MKENEIIESLSPLEKKIIPFLKESLEIIEKKANIDKVSLNRALKFLETKGVLKIKNVEEKIVDLGTNGIYYKKNHLPERVLLEFIEKNNRCTIQEAKSGSKISENEFKASLGTLKDKLFIELNNGKIILIAKKEEIMKKSPEEQLIEILPIDVRKLKDEQLLALENLKKRKEIVEIQTKNEISFELTEIGKKIAGQEIKIDLLEEVTPTLINEGTKGKKFRKYDIQAPVPRINGGKKHFVNQSIENAKRIWMDLGFKEMSGNMIDTSFWNFDALFTAQDHPVREMQDTFFLKGIETKLPDKKILESVKRAHESGVQGSKGWNYKWKEEEAKKSLLRTHTTCLSAHTLANLKSNEMPAKFFSIGKCFRNETLDWSHGFEFNQTEGIVVDEKANFRNLLGYLKEFFTKMGFKEIKIVPSFFPYTEPSVEIYGFNKDKNQWVEIGGAGMLRPEVVIPLLGKYVPVLAWGPGFDRTIMEYHKIKDLREMYSNNIKSLRNKKALIK